MKHPTDEEIIEALRADPAHEPSPLFWESFPDRVNSAIDRTPQAFEWRRAWRFVLVPVAGALAVALAVTLSRDADVAPQDANAPASAAGAPSVSAQGATPAVEDIEDDAAWAVVRTAADELAYDDVQAAGMAAAPGATELAAMELTAEEQAELVRLVELEMKRTGA